MTSMLTRLVTDSECAIRYYLREKVYGELDEVLSPLREEIRGSSRVTALLADRTDDGTIPYPPYTKWFGAHWVLVALAELGYPPGDLGLLPLCNQVYAYWLASEHLARVRIIRGRTRRCASQEGNALYAMLALGFADERADQLANNLQSWQWPDGGWNCDKTPKASHSSFHESLIPMRALFHYGRQRTDASATQAAYDAAEIFLKHHLFRRCTDGTVIDAQFLRLHYPSFYQYDILFGLTVLAEMDMIRDARCTEALDLLESKRLPDGCFPAEGQHYRVRGSRTTGRSNVDWGTVSPETMNPWVTSRALYVLHAAGRLTLE